MHFRTHRDWLRGGASLWPVWAVAAGVLLGTAVDDGESGRAYATGVDVLFAAGAAARSVVLWRRTPRAPTH